MTIFSMNTIINIIIPIAKRACLVNGKAREYSNVTAIAEVIVPPGCNKEVGNCIFRLIIIRTAMVSPIARPVARIIDVMIPDFDCGRMIFWMVWSFVAPIAYDPSFSPRGTERTASSERVMIIGSIIIPRTIEAVSMELPICGEDCKNQIYFPNVLAING